MNLHFLEEPQKLLDIAFARGRKRALEYPRQRTEFYTKKGKEIAKIDASADYLQERLFGVVQEFPSIKTLDPFYRDLFECIINIDEAKQTLSSISSVASLIKKQRVLAITRFKELKFENRAGSKKISSEYFGRVSSLVNGLKKRIVEYNGYATLLRELPSIRTKEESLILAGFPNVGKSTLMKKLTDSKVQVASYPFTTKGLNVGHFDRRHIQVQVIDTPGLLDRPLHARNKIELKAISALQYLEGLIIFVVDSTQELEHQKKLFIEIKKLFSGKKFIIVINKTDITPKELIESAKKEFIEFKFDIVEEGFGLNNLKEKLLERKK